MEDCLKCQISSLLNIMETKLIHSLLELLYTYSLTKFLLTNATCLEPIISQLFEQNLNIH